MSEADAHYCRVLLGQARHFRLRGSPFAFTLLEWAGNARRRATTKRQPEQAELF